MKQNLKNAGMQDAFEKVLKRYENGTASRYICYNLDILRNKGGKISFKQYTDCKQVIRTALQGKASLEGWLCQQGYATYWEMFERADPDSLQKLKQTRINWLKHLIEQCKKNNL